MGLGWMALAAALAAAQAPASAPAQQGEAQKPSQQGQTSDPRGGEGTGDELKGYGYGTQPGRESNASAQQSGDPKRQPSETPQLERPEPGAKPPQVTGRVVAVGKGTLSVQGDEGKVVKLQVTKKTAIVRDGKAVPLSSLKPGVEVRAGLASGKKGERTATRIDVGGAEAATGAPGQEDRGHPGQQPVQERPGGERE